MTPYDAPTGSVWDFEGELFVMLDERMSTDATSSPYRRYLRLVDGKTEWIGRYSHRDDVSEMIL